MAVSSELVAQVVLTVRVVGWRLKATFVGA